MTALNPRRFCSWRQGVYGLLLSAVFTVSGGYTVAHAAQHDVAADGRAPVDGHYSCSAKPSGAIEVASRSCEGDRTRKHAKRSNEAAVHPEQNRTNDPTTSSSQAPPATDAKHETYRDKNHHQKPSPRPHHSKKVDKRTNKAGAGTPRGTLHLKTTRNLLGQKSLGTSALKSASGRLVTDGPRHNNQEGIQKDKKTGGKHLTRSLPDVRPEQNRDKKRTNSTNQLWPASRAKHETRHDKNYYQQPIARPYHLKGNDKRAKGAGGVLELPNTTRSVSPTTVTVSAALQSALQPQAKHRSPTRSSITLAKKKIFIAAAAVAAQEGQRIATVPASVTIAQAILESRWGESLLSAKYNNYFGIKCSKKNPGSYATGCVVLKTKENASKFHDYDTDASFRTYAFPASSFKDHGNLLRKLPRYSKAFKNTHNADQFARELQKAGYATDPNYAANLIRTMRSHNLYQYNVSTSTPILPVTGKGTAKAALAEARKWLNYHENSDGSSRFAKYYRHPGANVAWCEFFIKYVGEKSGNANTIGGSKENGRVEDHKKWFKDRGQFLPRTANPRPGDIIFYRFPSGNHVEIVESVQKGRVTTIGGNTSSGKRGDQRNGDGVYRRVRPIDKTVSGFGRPAYRSASAPRLPIVHLQRVVDAAKIDPNRPKSLPVAPVDVQLLEKALARKGYLAKKYVDGRYGWQTVAAYSKYQQATGIPRARANGVPGIATLTKLSKGNFSITR